MLRRILIVNDAVRRDGNRDQPLVVLEARKMEHEIVAPRDGVVARVYAQEGAQVAEGAGLAVLEEG